jgi:predicted O-linked N-acetylglucosamine transferase (SPINDLY family)
VLRNGYLTYGVFNRVSKVSDAALAVWAQILRADGSARIALKDKGLDDAAIRQTLVQRFAAHGIAADRIVMLGRTSREEHLQAFGQIDISLDPFPQNGGVSTWEALYMGVPVVTRLGHTVSSRAAAAIVAAAGLPDWVAADDAAYLDIARKATPDRLAALRRDLPGMIEANCGPAAYARAVEAAYRQMWQAYCAAAAA